MKIYTKTGDDGTTGLFGGPRLKKNSSYFEAYGNVDELNSVVGWCLAAATEVEFEKVLIEIQTDLFVVGADLATPMNVATAIERLALEPILKLEKQIDEWEKELTPLTNFILPGGHELAARLQMARAACRRAERAIVHHQEQHACNPNTVVYINRLSDYFFVMARVVNSRNKISEIAWMPRS